MPAKSEVGAKTLGIASFASQNRNLMLSQSNVRHIKAGVSTEELAQAKKKGA